MTRNTWSLTTVINIEIQFGERVDHGSWSIKVLRSEAYPACAALRLYSFGLTSQKKKLQTCCKNYMKLCKYVHFQFVEFKFYSSRWIVFQNIYSATSSPINSIGLNVRASVDYFSQYLATRLAGKLENLICVRWHLKKTPRMSKLIPIVLN